MPPATAVCGEAIGVAVVPDILQVALIVGAQVIEDDVKLAIAGSTTSSCYTAKSPLGSGRGMASRSRVKWLFTTDKTRAKMAPAYSATSKESCSLCRGTRI